MTWKQNLVAPADNRIELPAEKLAAFCRRWGIARLELFGSALRGDFSSSPNIIPPREEAYWAKMALTHML